MSKSECRVCETKTYTSHANACEVCGIRPSEVIERSKLIAQMNDCFRGLKMSHESIGKWVVTQGIAAKGSDFGAEVTQKIHEFDAFTEENDPHGEHDFGEIEVQGEKVWWKIDLYDKTYTQGSPDPMELKETRRVLTVLFPSEY